MSTLTIDESRLKDVIKAAFVEVLEERPDLLGDVLEEALADAGLGYASQEGEHTPLVAHDEAFKLLKAT